MTRVSVIGVDLAKEVIQVCAMNHAGRIVSERSVKREKFLETIRGMPSGSTVYMEACQGSHYWSRQCEKLGFSARQIAPQFVRPFVKSQKNDRNDARAICEAGSRATMRFIPMKSEGQLELQSMHRIRERLLRNRTALMNQMRGILAEHGVVLRRGPSALKKFVVGEGAVSETVQALLRELYEELKGTEAQIAQITSRLKERARGDSLIRRLRTVPGIGLLSALALVVVSGDPKEFKNGRQFAAFLGLVPRQVSSGGKTVLLGISKRGDVYTRTLLIHGARAVVRYALAKDDPYSLWIRKLHAKYGTNHTAVAVANKNARVAWRILTSNEEFDPSKLAKLENIQ